MRRLFAVVLSVALLAALVSPVGSQPVLLGPGGMINTSTASTAVTNSVAATTLYTYTVPPGFVQGAAAPLHLALVGRMTTNQGAGAVGAANLGCNYGGSTASIALANGFTFPSSMTAQPVKIDLWLNQYATQGTAINGWLQGRLEVPNGAFAANASQIIVNAGVDSTTLNTTPQVITCVWQWGSAATTNSLVITNGKLIVGD